MLFNNSTKGYDFQEFSILVTFNPDFQKKTKSHGKKTQTNNKQKKEPLDVSIWKRICKNSLYSSKFQRKKIA